MSEPNMESEPQEVPEEPTQDEEEISWEDAVEDLERQKQMINEQASENEQTSENEQASADEEEISWEDAMEDLERQKQMINEQASADNKAEVPEQQIDPAPAVSVAEEQAPNLQFILDIPLQITVELGRKRLLVNELLQLHQGSVLELAKEIGEPFEVLVNQKLIARGEVVVINEKFGVRITDIISPVERVQQL